MNDIAGIIVAGGQSRRLGQDKRRLRLWGDDGPMLLEHTLNVLMPLCAELVIVLNDPEAWPGLPARIVPDVYADAGALGGVYAGLRAVTHEHALVVAADMPLLNPALLAAMSVWPRTYDALVPCTSTGGTGDTAHQLEPMHAIYRRTCLAPLRTALDAHQYRITTFLNRVYLETIPPETLRRYDPQGNSFSNINTPADLAAIQHTL